ncbi:MAG: 3-dehydroquinate synthase [Candidatus Woesearchaeota archaeon]|jgi:3-dehydroquinate synthase|nr:3-dehydroquinate synthase [Candidatus Woesearchaeota archaeon]MDP7458107.1 3-dehydroquinate synthase [Candidatus Woesearchaeota archaeon]
METVHLNLKKAQDNSYDILIGSGVLSKIPTILKKKRLANRYLIITDNNIRKLFGNKLLKDLRNKKLNVDIISFKAGEQSKNISTYNQLIESAHKLELDRDSVIIALGGGVVGDIAGFVAATYMRGINYIQIPTSLLAQVDSSIGGKVAIDLKQGKNSCGAFYQPKAVYIDISLLKNLPKKELLNGLAEIVKHAIIRDKQLFGFIEKNIDKILNKDEKTLTKLVKRNCQIKAKIVQEDEREKNLRKIVNYGHTIGHALETLTHYKKYSHGQAISIGMIVESIISNKLGWLSKKELERQINLFEKLGLQTKMPRIQPNKIINELKKDKKSVLGIPQFTLPNKIGTMKTIDKKYGLTIDKKVIISALKES